MKKPPPCFVSDLLKAVEALAPARLAESWDNVGLQVGHPAAPVRRVMTCLELTAQTLDEAIQLKADAVVAHHPLIFQPLAAVNLAQPAGELVGGLLRAGIALVAAHTNLDSAVWGTNAVLAEALGLKPESRLIGREGETEYKFVVFVPLGHEQAVIEAIARGGGGRIGAYTHCTFRTPGTGTFFGGAEARPVVGEAGRLEQVEEFRIETNVSACARGALLREVLAVHPYEEPAYNFFPIAAGSGKEGLGAVAPLEPPRTAEALACEIKERLGLPAVRLSGPPAKKVKRVALCSGSGGSFVGKVAGRAEAYITGEINYHHAVEAHARSIAVIEIGHFESEALVAAPLAEKLAAAPRLAEAGVDVVAATRERSPFVFL